MDMSASLTLEQKFKLQVLKDQVKDLSQGEADKICETDPQSIFKNNNEGKI